MAIWAVALKKEHAIRENQAKHHNLKYSVHFCKLFIRLMSESNVYARA
jgi:hypothetical protein